jgi:hypothetical protein
MRPRYLSIAGLLLALLTPQAGFAQASGGWESKRGDERFAPLSWLVGEWRGYGKFENRTTYIHRKYSYDLGGMFLIERTLDVFPPPELSTDFEVHQDFVVYYRETRAGALRAKGFFVESYVTSATVSVGGNKGPIVIETTEIENGPPGMRTRFTLTPLTADRFKETFEIAMPEKEFALVEELVMERIQ